MPSCNYLADADAFRSLQHVEGVRQAVLRIVTLAGVVQEWVKDGYQNCARIIFSLFSDFAQKSPNRRRKVRPGVTSFVESKYEVRFCCSPSCAKQQVLLAVGSTKAGATCTRKRGALGSRIILQAVFWWLPTLVWT